MDDIKISQGIEKQEEKQEQMEINQALKEDDDNSKDSKSILIMIVIILGVLAFSFGGFKTYDYFTSADVVNVDELHKKNLQGDLKEGYVYNGYSFVYVDGLWWTEIKQGNTLLKVPLHFGPKEVNTTKISGKLSPKFNYGDEVYIAIDPEVTNKYYSLAISELSFNVVKGMNRKPVGVCSKTNSACDNRSIISCNNTKGKPVIELKLGNENKIELKDTCILVTGQDMDIVKAVNRLIWQWYGVIKS